MSRSPRPLAVLAAVLAATACASAPRVAPAPSADAPSPPAAAPVVTGPATAPRGPGLEIVAVPADSEVEIEGVRRAPASVLAAENGGVVPLAPGVYRVSIRRPGYATWRGEVSIGSGVDRIEVTLAERR